MASVYNSYLEGNERLQAIREAEEDLYFSKLFTMLEMVDLRLDMNMKSAEFKVFKESGTYDDLDYLYEEAQQEAQTQKKGIIATIIESIGKIIRSIGNKIKSIFSKEDPNKEVDVDPVDIENSKTVVKFWENISNGFTMIKSGNMAGLGTFIKGLAVPTLAAGAAAGTAVAYKKMKLSDVQGLTNKAQSALDQIGSALNGIKDKVGEFVQPFIQKVQAGVGKIRTWLSGWMKKLGLGGKDSEQADDAQQTNGNNDNGTTKNNNDGNNNGNGKPKGQKPETPNNTNGQANNTNNSEQTQTTTDNNNTNDQNQGNTNNNNQQQVNTNDVEQQQETPNQQKQPRHRKNRGKRKQKRQAMNNNVARNAAYVNDQATNESFYDDDLYWGTDIFGYDLYSESVLQGAETYDSDLDEINALLDEL